jgi:hypothetical protein
MSIEKIHLIGTRTHDLPDCNIVAQPTTLPRAPLLTGANFNHYSVTSVKCFVVACSYSRMDV